MHLCVYIYTHIKVRASPIGLADGPRPHGGSGGPRGPSPPPAPRAAPGSSSSCTWQEGGIISKGPRRDQ